jgi:hypothetical protein
MAEVRAPALESQECPMKKGRHRRYEEARALKRSRDGDDIESLMDRLDDDPFDLPITEEANKLGDEMEDVEAVD